MAGVLDLNVDIGSGRLSGVADHPVASLNLSTHHPSTHGLIRLHLQLDDEIIVAARTEIGYMHRGAEKLLESRDYRQGLALTNRHDWLGAFSGELGYALAVESMLGLDVPERAQWLRTGVAELSRIISHLYFLDYFPVESVAATHEIDDTYPPGVSAMSLEDQTRAASHRERAQQLLEALTGGRVHPMYVQIGGLRQDVPAGWLTELTSFISITRAQFDHIAPYLDIDYITEQLRSMGVISNALAMAHGASGAVGRASGVDVDLRRDQPYAAYAELGDAVKVMTAEDGDVLSRLLLLRAQIQVSLDILERCVAKLDQLHGPINVALPKTLRAPEGIHYGWSETPLGIGGYLVVSHGEKTPWRVHMRTPSFAHAALLSDILVGEPIGNLAPIVGSLFVITGDADR